MSLLVAHKANDIYQLITSLLDEGAFANELLWARGLAEATSVEMHTDLMHMIVTLVIVEVAAWHKRYI